MTAGLLRTRPWTTGFAGRPEVLEVVPVDPVADAARVGAWGRAEHVARWWPVLTGPEADVAAYLVAQQARPGAAAWIARLDGEPFAYLETYQATLDPLAGHYPARPGDRGFHLLVGPADWLGTGRPRLLGRAVVAELLSAPGPGAPDQRRVVCEPDAANARMAGFVAALGFTDEGRLDLPDKRAALMVCERAAFAARWPDDLARAEARHGGAGR